MKLTYLKQQHARFHFLNFRISGRIPLNNTARKSVLYISLSSVIFILLSVSPCFAGAWTMQKGKLYDRFSLNYYFADDNFNGDGDRTDFPDNGDFQDFHASNYIEYGLTDRITVINSICYKYLDQDNNNSDTKSNGIGDIDLGVKFRLSEGSLGVLSVQGLSKIPEAYDKNAELPLGNGQYDFELRLLYGRSLYPHIPGYCNFEIGYRWRLDAPADELRYLAEFGMDFTKQLYARVKLDGIYSMHNGSKFDASGNPTLTNNFDLGKLDITFGYMITGSWAIEAEYTPEIYGQNTAAGSTYTLAISYKML